MSSAANVIVLLGLGIAGILLAVQRRKKTIKEDFGAFVDRIQLLPPPQPAPPKATFDVEGYVTGFGNPDWRKTHEPAVHTAPAVSLLIEGGATCVGRTVMDEMAYSINGENKYYGTPTNPAAPSRVPGGSSSGSAVAVAAELVDFSLGWFARDPNILHLVGHTLLQLPLMESRKPSRVIIADDCFQLTNIPSGQTVTIVIQSTEKLFGRQVLNHMNIGKYIADKVPSLKYFQTEESRNGGDSISDLKALCNAFRLCQRYEFKRNHEDWVNSVKPKFGPGISDRVRAALDTNTDDENISHSLRAREEAREAINSLVEDDGILVMPTTPGPPPQLKMKGNPLEDFRIRAFTLLSIAGMSGCCQVSIPVGQYDKCPLAVSFLARHGGDGFLLDTVRAAYSTLQEQVEIV